MGLLALIFGILGGFCMALGIITAAELMPLLGKAFTWTFWFMLAGILVLISIAFNTGSGGGVGGGEGSSW